MMNENVNHPAHYNAPGRKECIVEMLEKFGTEKVQAFCELNAYKYRYRHDMKNGQEDLEKAAWYEEKFSELQLSDTKYQIAAFFGLEAQEQQLIEEMAELTQAICKRKRGRDVMDNLIEECADVQLMLYQVIYLLDCDLEVQEVMNQKIRRTIERIGEVNGSIQN